MNPITMYEAEDGKLFRDEYECLMYDRQARLTDEVIDRIKVWDGTFDRIKVSVKNLNWTETGQYFFAPDKECREAINYAFEEVGNVLPFAGLTEKSTRVMWSELEGEFIDYDEFCREAEEKRRVMN